MTLELVITIIGCSVVVFGALALFWFSPDRRARRALQKSPIPIAQAPIGKPNKIAGVVEAIDEPVETLTGQTAVYAEVAVLRFYRRQRQGSVSEEWRSVAEERHGQRFGVKDDTGVVMVEPAGCEWQAPERMIEVDWENLPPPIAELLDRHEDSIRRNVPTRIRLRYLRGGDPISVFGTLSASGDDTHHARIGAGGVFALGPARAS